jgi:hypothetical protein
MLRYLLDEHISPRVAVQVSRKCPEIVIVSLQVWHDGALLQADDDTLLRAAAQEGFTLVTYDQRTIPALLFEWGQAGFDHGGVIFIDERCIAPEAIGTLVKALITMWNARSNLEWKNRLIYARDPA